MQLSGRQQPGLTGAARLRPIPRFNTRAPYGPRFVKLPGVTGAYVSTPDSVAVSITGDIDVRVLVAMADWTPSATSVVFAKRVNGVGTESWRFAVGTLGTFQFVPSLDGANDAAFQTSSAAPGFSDGTAHWIRVTRIAATGVMNYYTSENGTDWTQLGSADRTSDAGALFDSTSPLEIGSINAGTSSLLTGTVYRAQLLDGIDGTLAAGFDAREAKFNQTTFTGENGEVWTINGLAAIQA